MLTPGDGIRVDIAFASAPDASAPAWVDVTSDVLLDAGIGITRGRSPEGGVANPGVCSMTLKNDDGRYTAENPASPFYPNVKINRRVRVTFREPSTLGTRNLIAAADADVEAGVGPSWFGNYDIAAGIATLASSTAQAFSGTKSVLVTWPTLASTEVGAGLTYYGSKLVAGRRYVARARVYVPAGAPHVRFGDVHGLTPLTTTTARSTWQTLEVSFVSNGGDLTLAIRPKTNPTAGDQVYVDALELDEAAATNPASTVNPAGVVFSTTAPTVKSRFVGFGNDWPVEWPSGPSLARVSFTATDRLKRLGARRTLRSVPECEILLDNPSAYFPLGEPEGATTAGDVSGYGLVKSATIRQSGSGGTITFGSSTGAPTDELSAALFTRSSPSAGKALTAYADAGFGAPTLDGIAFEACFSTTGVDGWIAGVYESEASYLTVGLSGTGQAVVTAAGAGSLAINAFGTSTLSDGKTHVVAVQCIGNGAGSQAQLIVDGVVEAVLVGPWANTLPVFRTFEIGGHPGNLFSGTICHAAAFAFPPDVTRFAAHATALRTGFAGESSDARVARLLGYAGLTSSEYVLDAGRSTSIEHVTTTDKTALAVAQTVTDTEGGVLLVNRDGLVAMHSRSRRYAVPPALTLTASQIRPGVTFTVDDQGLANDVTGSHQTGASYRATNDASVDDYGVATESLELVTTSDAEVASAVNWRVATRGVPHPKTPGATIDLLDDTIRTATLDLDVSSRLVVNALPTQAPASSIDGFVEGYTESISSGGWLLSVNTSNADLSGRVWKINDPEFGSIGTTNRIAY